MCASRPAQPTSSTRWSRSAAASGRSWSLPATPFYLVSRAPDGTLEAALVLYLQETVDPFAAQPGSPTLRMLVGGVWHCYDTTLLTSRPVTDDLVMSLAGTMRMLADD